MKNYEEFSERKLPSKYPLHDRFKYYTPEEITIIKKNNCILHKCPYLGKATWSWSRSSKQRGTIVAGLMCNYILMTGKPRECMPDTCNFWKDEVKTQRSIDFNKYQVNEYDFDS